MSRRKLIKLSNLKDKASAPELSIFVEQEGFECFFGVPLISNHHVAGVLEIFHRSPLEPNEDWFEFLGTVANQAAISIANRMVLQSLEQSNLDLKLAYDETIEGWSQALDLRDRETEGHSLRVTQLTGKVAAKFGFSPKVMRSIRWGALLHDIGKMGIPDSILLKPGPLTAEEWDLMKQHPVFAHQLLAPIKFCVMRLRSPSAITRNGTGAVIPRDSRENKSLWRRAYFPLWMCLMRCSPTVLTGQPGPETKL